MSLKSSLEETKSIGIPTSPTITKITSALADVQIAPTANGASVNVTRGSTKHGESAQRYDGYWLYSCFYILVYVFLCLEKVLDSMFLWLRFFFAVELQKNVRRSACTSYPRSIGQGADDKPRMPKHQRLYLRGHQYDLQVSPGLAPSS